MQKHGKLSFYQAWLCEAIRLKESQWGPLDDNKARRLAQKEHSPLAKVAIRAQELSQSIGLTNTVSTLSSAGWLALVLTFSGAIITGAGLAFAALGSGTQPVNIVWALMTLLGFNFIFLILWCIAILFPKTSGGRLGQLWPWMTRKLARRPNMGLAVQAWWTVLHQAQVTRWLLSTGTHLIWMTITLAAAVTMVLVLSIRQYDFVWETTLLSPEVFVRWVSYLALLPQYLGFPIPDSETVQGSGSLPALSAESTRRLWSGWLLGCLIAYGFLPRALLALLSGILLFKRRSYIGPDLASPYYLSILNRMSSFGPRIEGEAHLDSILNEGIDPRAIENRLWTNDNLLIPIELDSNEDWPPSGLGAALNVSSSIDSGESRKRILMVTAQTRPNSLVLACDTRHSPDRGTMRLIADLSELSKRTLLWLRHSQAAHAHTEAWLTQLRSLPHLDLIIHDDTEGVMQWLERHHE